jgi:sigma-B regulation protein RsbU (phosphoserine phosphatase)
MSEEPLMPKLNKKPDSENTRLDKRLLELTALFEVSRSLTSTLNLHAILENVLRIAMGHMLISRGMILLQQGGEETYVVEALKGIPRNLLGTTVRIDAPPTDPVTIEHAGETEWACFFRKMQIELLTPLISSQGFIGLLAFGPKINNDAYVEEEIEFLDSLSNIAASSVANGLMVQEIQNVNRRLDRKIQQLNTIFDIGSELNATLDREKIGSLVGFAVMGELLVNKCAIYLKEEEKLFRLICKGVDLPEHDGGELGDPTEPVLLEDTDRFEEYREKGLAVVVPMRMQQKTKGMMLVGSKISGGRFDEADLEFLKTLGNQAMTAIENARLFEEALEKQRMEEELNLARSIQQGMLPKALPQPEGYEIAGNNISSREVGGDYYDIIPIDAQRFGIAIGDVAGKGAGAALLMANLQASLQALVPGGMGIDEMMSRINNQVYRNTAPDKFITFFYGELDVSNHTLTYCNAGHNFPLHIRKSGEFKELSEGGLILGMMPEVVYRTAKIPIAPSDRIVLFTDGVTEAMNKEEEEYGETRLKDFILGHPESTVTQLMDGVVEAVKDFTGKESQADDMTMVVIKRKK